MKETKTWGKKAFALLMTAVMALTIVPLTAVTAFAATISEVDDVDIIEIETTTQFDVAIAGVTAVPSNETYGVLGGSVKWTEAGSSTGLIGEGTFDEGTPYAVSFTLESLATGGGSIKNVFAEELTSLTIDFHSPDDWVPSVANYTVKPNPNDSELNLLDIEVVYAVVLTSNDISMDIHLDAPEVDDEPGYVQATFSGDVYYAEISTDWYLEDDLMEPSDVFALETDYWAIIQLAPNFGYVFDDGEGKITSVDINYNNNIIGPGAISGDVRVAEGGKLLAFDVKYQVPPDQIKSADIEITLAAPKVGLSVSEWGAAASSDQFYTTATPTKTTFDGSDAGSEFAGEEQYVATVVLTAKDGYVFPAESNPNKVTSADIIRKGAIEGDISGDVRLDSVDEVANKKLTFEVISPMTEAALIDVSFDIDLASPVTKAKVTSADNKGESPFDYVTSTDWSLDGEFVPIGSEFGGEREYRAVVTLFANDGFKFGPTVSSADFVSESGLKALMVKYGVDVEREDKTLKVTIDFEETKAVPVDDGFAINLTSPDVGTQAKIAENINGDEEYVTSTDWYLGRNLTNPLGTGFNFKEDSEYTAVVTLTAKQGYYFDDGVTSNDINGTLKHNMVELGAEVVSADRKLTITLPFEMTGGAIPIDDGLFIDLDAPVVAKSADIAEVPDDQYKYEAKTKWSIGSVGVDMPFDFEGETAYTATIFVGALDGYKFEVGDDEITSADVDGSLKTLMEKNQHSFEVTEKEVVISVNFDPTDPNFIEMFNLYLPVPAAGELAKEASADIAPEKLAAPISTSWNEGLVSGRFKENTLYIATVVINKW